MWCWVWHLAACLIKFVPNFVYECLHWNAIASVLSSFCLCFFIRCFLWLPFLSWLRYFATKNFRETSVKEVERRSIFLESHPEGISSCWLANENLYFKVTPSMSFPGWEMQLLVFWDNQLVFYKACTISFLCLSIHLCIYCYRYCLHFHTEEAIRVLSPHEEIQFQCRKKPVNSKMWYSASSAKYCTKDDITPAAQIGDWLS